MSFKNKLKDLVSLSAANLLATVILAIFWLYLASILQKISYGELAYLFSIANVATAISLMGFRTVIVVYESKKENIFSSSFIVVLISANITAGISFILTGSVITSILIIGMVIFNIILSGLNSHQRYTELSKHKMLRSVLIVIFSLILYEYFGINGILFGYFISTLIIIKDLNSLMKNKKIEFSVLKPKIPFMLHSFAMRLTEVFVRWGDKLFIGSLFGFSFLGSYHFSFQYLLLLVTIPQSLSIYLIPQESQGKKNKKIKNYSIIISFLITIISIIIIPFGINALMPQYEESIIPMQILSLAIIPLIITSIQESQFFGKENSRIVLYGSILQSGFYWCSIILLGENLGLIGLSFGFVLAVIIKCVFYFIFRKKH